ncbi:hypothetical protein TWF694_001380 [Orbilia ellipsospora]|uniref:Uncharacterized protein n=1 Tax=Orbilia ellipsospora TaxID=2528407 RepID=A0AAV9XTZ7_9PEZI
MMENMTLSLGFSVQLPFLHILSLDTGLKFLDVEIPISSISNINTPATLLTKISETPLSWCAKADIRNITQTLNDTDTYTQGNCNILRAITTAVKMGEAFEISMCLIFLLVFYWNFWKFTAWLVCPILKFLMHGGVYESRVALMRVEEKCTWEWPGWGKCWVPIGRNIQKLKREEKEKEERRSKSKEGSRSSSKKVKIVEEIDTETESGEDSGSDSNSEEVIFSPSVSKMVPIEKIVKMPYIATVESEDESQNGEQSMESSQSPEDVRSHRSSSSPVSQKSRTSSQRSLEQVSQGQVSSEQSSPEQKTPSSKSKVLARSQVPDRESSPSPSPSTESQSSVSTMYSVESD